MANEPVPSKVVEATAAAVASKKLRGRSIETAMADAVLAVSKESEEIWAKQDLKLEDKNKLIAELTHPDNVRKRMFEARDEVRAANRAEEQDTAAKED